MPKYQDAVGFLLELRSEINEDWFSRVVDLAIQLNGTAASEEDFQEIWLYLLRAKSYVAQAASVPPLSGASQSGIAPVFLEKISDFENFKKLSPSLNLIFDKKITLVFGKNGSGKSSICQALKTLASPIKPINPLHNVREQSPTSPAFEYQFRGWTNPSKWNETAGYGSQSQFIKYFDSTVAISNTTGNMRAENTVEVSVFRLELFDFCRSIVSLFQQSSINKIQQNRNTITLEMQGIVSRLTTFVNTQVEPFISWKPESSLILEDWLKSLAPFGAIEASEIVTLENELTQVKSAATEQGRLTLQAQLNIVKQSKQKLVDFHTDCKDNLLSELQSKEVSLQQKNSAMMELSKGAFPIGVEPSAHNELIHSAAKLTSYSETETCPLCLQTLSENAKKLFNAYHKHLTSTIQSEVNALSQELSQGISHQEKIRTFQSLDMSLILNICQPDFIDGLIFLVEAIKASVPQKDQPQSQGNALLYSRYTELFSYIERFGYLEIQLEETLKMAKESGEKLAVKSQKLQGRIATLRANQALQGEMNNLLAVCNKSSEHTQQVSKFNGIDFTSLYRKLTLKGKEAHADLVLGTFENKLDAEYISMSGMNLSQLGVKLATKGSDQEITITPNIGSAPVHRVLSEGEQKIHSLAVFMAEAMAHPYQMLVFDDPVTSFDYNYVSNFCERIRDFIRSQPNTQMVVLTHNWDFFVNLQTTLNRSGFNNSLSIQVLEDCSTTAEYIEKWDDLYQQIHSIVNALVEPTAEEKEKVSGLMRRLIERLTNSYIFNEQRHQYKIKALQDSNFHQFTKIVPLLEGEANELKDLYSNLSPPEHDDVRNYYTTKSRLQFKNWFDRVVAVKITVESRRV